jgi:methyl-accepting chemotaxis protein
MTWLADRRISPKLLAGLGIVALLAALVGFVGFMQLGRVARSDQALFSEMLVPPAQIVDVASTYRGTRPNVRDALLARDKE